jgi:hypothetical protein
MFVKGYSLSSYTLLSAYSIKGHLIMTSSMKHITLWGGVMGPNPSKVGIILAELKVPFVRKYVAFADIKALNL